MIHGPTKLNSKAFCPRKLYYRIKIIKKIFYFGISETAVRTPIGPKTLVWEQLRLILSCSFNSLCNSVHSNHLIIRWLEWEQTLDSNVSSVICWWKYRVSYSFSNLTVSPVEFNKLVFITSTFFFVINDDDFVKQKTFELNTWFNLNIEDIKQLSINLKYLDFMLKECFYIKNECNRCCNHSICFCVYSNLFVQFSDLFRSYPNYNQKLICLASISKQITISL